MSDHVSLQLDSRDVVGKAVRQLRREGQVPAVIHDHGKASVHVQAAYLPIYKTYQRAGKHHPVDLTVGDKKYLALIKDVSFEPRKNRLQHVVFNAIKQNEKVTAEIPLSLSEDIPAAKANLTVLTHLENITVEGLPKSLVDSLTVDASALAEVGDKLTLANLTLPHGLTLLTDPETVIATVEMPKDQVAEANAAAAEQAAADGKVAEESGEVPAATDDKTDKPDTTPEAAPKKA